MQPFFIVNPKLSAPDIKDAILEKMTYLQTMQSLLVFGAFDGDKLKVSEGLLCEGLWVMIDLVRQIEALQSML